MEALIDEAVWAGTLSSKNPEDVIKGRIEGTLDALGTASFDIRVDEQAVVTLRPSRWTQIPAYLVM